MIIIKLYFYNFHNKNLSKKVCGTGDKPEVALSETKLL